MPIREDQLLVWSEQKESRVPQQTFEEIRNLLTSNLSPIKPRAFDIYLQGSCINETNIDEHCDADIVVQLNQTADGGEPTLGELSAFREQVRQTLVDLYGEERVQAGKRALKVCSEAGEGIADVLPCIRYGQGIQFLTTENVSETRYPRLNHQNSRDKQRRTNGHYKNMIRIFKQARAHLANQKLNRKRAGSSYFLECLLYNVPDYKFYSPFQQSYVEVIVWLQQADLSQFVCQHEQHALFGDAPEQWELKKAQKLIRAYAELWQQWLATVNK